MLINDNDCEIWKQASLSALTLYNWFKSKYVNTSFINLNKCMMGDSLPEHHLKVNLRKNDFCIKFKNFFSTVILYICNWTSVHLGILIWLYLYWKTIVLLLNEKRAMHKNHKLLWGSIDVWILFLFSFYLLVCIILFLILNATCFLSVLIIPSGISWILLYVVVLKNYHMNNFNGMAEYYFSSIIFGKTRVLISNKTHS